MSRLDIGDMIASCLQAVEWVGLVVRVIFVRWLNELKRSDSDGSRMDAQSHLLYLIEMSLFLKVRGAGAASNRCQRR